MFFSKWLVTSFLSCDKMKTLLLFICFGQDVSTIKMMFHIINEPSNQLVCLFWHVLPFFTRKVRLIMRPLSSRGRGGKWPAYPVHKPLICNTTVNVTMLKHLEVLIPCHEDVIKWKHFPRNWPFVRGIHRSPVNSLHKGQWRVALMFSLIYVWINDWVNNREAGDLRRYRAHSDVIVMSKKTACQ